MGLKKTEILEHAEEYFKSAFGYRVDVEFDPDVEEENVLLFKYTAFVYFRIPINKESNFLKEEIVREIKNNRRAIHLRLKGQEVDILQETLSEKGYGNRVFYNGKYRVRGRENESILLGSDLKEAVRRLSSSGVLEKL